MRKISEEQRGMIVDTYRETFSAPATARRLGIGATTVYRVLDQAGIDVSLDAKSVRQRKSSDEVEAEIARRYAAGERSGDLAKAFGYSMAGIRKVVRRQGGEVGPRGNRYRDFTEAEIAAMAERWTRGESQTAIAQAFDSSQLVVSRVLTAHGFSVVPRRQVGPGHGSWKGGRTRTGEGYWQVHLPPDDPFSIMRNRQGYVPEHRLVMARMLGRPLTDAETVHHIDGDRQNNDPSNLQLRQGKHGTGVTMRCADCGSHNIVSEPFAVVTED